MRKLLKLASALAFLAAILTVQALAAEGDYIYTLVEDPSPLALAIAARTQAVYAPQGVYMTGDHAIVEQLQSMGQVQSVSIDHAVDMPDEEAFSEDSLSLFALQTDYWAFDLVDAQYAFDQKITGEGVVVGIIDTGLAPQFQSYTDATVLTGYNCLVTEEDSAWRDTTDEQGHGTMVASVIADRDYGIASAVSLISFKCYGSGENSGTIATVSKAIYLAADCHCDVVNMSLGGIVTSDVLKTACEYAYDKGTILVGAAGNRSGLDVTSVRNPAGYECVVCVSNVGSTGELCSSSVRNSTVDVAAPGEDVTVLSKSYSYTTTTGTSFSSPLVAGIAALALSVNEDMTQDEFMKFIEETSTDKGDTGKDIKYGWGIINVEKLLKAVQKDLEEKGLSGDSIASKVDTAHKTVSIYIPASENRQVVYLAFFNARGKLVGIEQYVCESGCYLRRKDIEYPTFSVTFSIWSLSSDICSVYGGYSAPLTS